MIVSQRVQSRGKLGVREGFLEKATSDLPLDVVAESCGVKEVHCGVVREGTVWE